MANLPIPAGDELSYNGFVFDSTTSSELTITPVEDRAKRTNTHYVHEVTARMKIATGIGAVAAAARAALSQPAGMLVYRGRGVGTHRIGGPRGNPDLIWGPKPGALKFRPLGGSSAIELTWSVRWATMTCADAVNVGQPMEFTYSVDYDVDYAGLTTRRYNAFLRIPQSRRAQGDRVVQATADLFRESATPTVPPSFRRTTPAAVRISEDKCECTLSCVDEEFPNNIFPEGVVQAEASYSIEGQPGNSFMWMARLSATYEVAKGVSVATALNAFFSLLQDKIKKIQQGIKAPSVFIPGAAAAIAAGAATPTPAPAKGAGFKALLAAISPAALLTTTIVDGATSSSTLAKNSSPCIIPWGLSFSEPEIYGRNKVQITAQFKVVGVDRDFMLANSGMWRKAPGPNWQRWIASVAIHQGPRGYAQLVLDAGSDVIHDLCRPATVTPPPDGGDATLRSVGETELRNGTTPRKPRTPKPPKPINVVVAGAGAVRSGVYGAGQAAGQHFFDTFQFPAEEILDGVVRTGMLAFRRTPISAIFPAPTLENSWLEYMCTARVENDSGVVIGKTLPTAPLTDTALSSSSTSDPFANFASTAGRLESSTPPPTGAVFAQQRTVLTAYIVISGFGIRAGFPVPRPELVGIGGATPVACSRVDSGEGFEQLIAGNCGVPIYYARWQLRYAVVGELPVGGALVPPNDVIT